jgi:hypothetical protein
MPAAATTEQIQVHPGREDEFIAAVRAQTELSGKHGGTSVLRQAMFAGPTSGTYRPITVYEDGAARAAAIDAFRQEASIPLRDFLRSANPGGVSLGRAMLSGIGEAPAAGGAGAVNLTFVLQPQPGHQANILAAIPESLEGITKNGATASAWQTFAAGPGSNNIALGVSADNMAALQSAMDATVAAGPSTLVQLAQSGADELQSSSVSVRADL